MTIILGIIIYFTVVVPVAVLIGKALRRMAENYPEG